MYVIKYCYFYLSSSSSSLPNTSSIVSLIISSFMSMISDYTQSLINNYTQYDTLNYGLFDVHKWTCCVNIEICGHCVSACDTSSFSAHAFVNARDHHMTVSHVTCVCFD